MNIYNIRFDADYQSTTEFYKDEGGKNSHIQYNAKVIIQKDNSNIDNIHEILNELNYSSLQFIPELYYFNEYDNNDKVNVQHILSFIRINQNNKDFFEIEDNKIIVKFRFRIDEVSKNHRNNKFVIKFSANNSQNFIIGNNTYVFENTFDTEPITVLSKRKDRKRSRITGSFIQERAFVLPGGEFAISGGASAISGGASAISGGASAIPGLPDMQKTSPIANELMLAVENIQKNNKFYNKFISDNIVIEIKERNMICRCICCDNTNVNPNEIIHTSECILNKMITNTV